MKAMKMKRKNASIFWQNSMAEKESKKIGWRSEKEEGKRGKVTEQSTLKFGQ